MAAEKLEGQTLILAGAGSGKTRTITFKIAHMIKEKNINPQNILALTFTNKAAREMKERAEKLIGSNTDIVITTFHSFALRLLRIYSERIGYGNNFNVYDTNDQKSIIKKIIKSYDWEKMYKPTQILNRISRIKELGIKYTDISKAINTNILENAHLKIIYREYQEKLEKYNAMDFSDILTNTYELLNDSYVLDKIQSRYIYILVDEYQDTNEIQYKIIKKIVSKNKNICVVGDEDQSIYAFRGANIKNILNFEKDYPEAKIIKLEQNYRSTQNILDGANSVIKNNTSSKGKKLWSARENGEKIKIYNAKDINDEANFVANKIRELYKNGKNYKNFAILYRTNAQSRALEEALHRNSIPHKIFGGLGFFERKEIKDLIAYLQLINNSSDDVSFERNMVISGDNASGKSTYLKMVAINCILAQGLGFAYGDSLELSYGHVMTSMDVSDDIEVGDSYFITESKTILRMIESLEKSGFHYFFIDELFKGTNTIERIGSGLGIVRWLSRHDCLYMISSHDIELVAASGAVNDNYHFDSRYVDGKIVFDFQIKQGAAVTKNAVNTLKSLHFPSEITQTSQELIGQYEKTGKWSLNRMLSDKEEGC